MFERLENRQLLSVTYETTGGTLIVRGDSAANWIGVERSNGLLRVKLYGTGGGAELGHVSETSIYDIVVLGGAGNDLITIADNISENVTIFGGAGADYLKGGAGWNDLYGHGSSGGPSGHDEASDDGGADTLVSGLGDNYLFGQKGDDELFTDNYAVSGNEFMFGGDDADTFHIRGHGANAYAEGEAGNDRLLPSQNATQHVTYSGGAGWDWVDYRAWSAGIYAKPDGVTNSGLRSGAREQLIGTDVESIDGTNFDDHFSGNNSGNAFAGHDGDDLMYGYSGNDTLVGGAGEDTIYASFGNDLMIGEGGDDTLFGDAGNDTAYGGDQNDLIDGGEGNDYLSGDNGSDEIRGGAGNDLLIGGPGADYLDAHDGVFANDTILGNNLNGSGGEYGEIDVAYIDRLFINHTWIGDNAQGVESIVF